MRNLRGAYEKCNKPCWNWRKRRERRTAPLCFAQCERVEKKERSAQFWKALNSIHCRFLGQLPENIRVAFPMMYPKHGNGGLRTSRPGLAARPEILNCMTRSGLICPYHTKLSVQFRLWNCWGLCWYRCRPIIFHVITAGDVDGWCLNYCGRCDEPLVPRSHQLSLSTSGCEIVGDATTAGYQHLGLLTDFVAMYSCSLWPPDLSSGWKQLQGGKVGPCGQTTSCLVVGPVRPNVDVKVWVMTISSAVL